MAKKLNCREVALRLQTYLDGELDEERCQAFKAHLDACVDCGLEAEVFSSLKSDISGCANTDEDALARLRKFAADITQQGVAH